MSRRTIFNRIALILISGGALFLFAGQSLAGDSIFDRVGKSTKNAAKAEADAAKKDAKDDAAAKVDAKTGGATTKAKDTADDAEATKKSVDDAVSATKAIGSVPKD